VFGLPGDSDHAVFFYQGEAFGSLMALKPVLIKDER
jgi:hypothetical protein